MSLYIIGIVLYNCNCVIMLFFIANIFFIIQIFNINSANKIWIIRHCDKPNNHKNPCCSDSGYERSIGWANYFKDYLGNKINIITSDFHSKTICVDKLNHTKNNCQKSQRMFLTTHYLSKQLLDMNYNIETINLNYCVGDSGKIFNHIQNMKNHNRNINDIILIWEHNEIINFIRKYNIKIGLWKRKLKKNYDIVFMIDTNKNKLYYSCYDYKNKKINKCSHKIKKWLYKFDNIENYQNTNILSATNYQPYPPQYNKKIIFLFAVLIVIIIGFSTGLFIRKQITLYYNRYEYIEIK